LKVFPSIRELRARKGTSESLIASSGAACRMQIQQGAGVKAIHPILLIANLIKEANDDAR
jgi:Fe-S oxidoreductase